MKKKENSLLAVDLTTPKARAGRVLYVRKQLLNLTRSELCSDNDLVEASLKSWEAPIAGGLTQKGAEKLSLVFRKFKIHCTAAWLLYGIGLGPTKHSESLCIDDDEEQQIANELLVFRQQSNSIDTVIKDDAMAPLLLPGYYVAGIVTDKLKDVVNRECIIITKNNDIVVRVVKQDSSTGQYILACLNSKPIVAQPEIKNINISYAAPIIWIRKKRTSNSLALI